MTLIEFIGFIITMGAMTFLIIRKIWEDWRRKTHPQDFDHEKVEQEQTLKKFLKSLDIDMEEEEEEEMEIKETMPKPLPPPKPIFKIRGDKNHHYKPIHRYEPNDYFMLEKESISRANRMVRQLSSRKQMVIYQEIMNPPVSLR